MPTDLRKTVIRRCTSPYNHRGKRLVVALEPGDVITIREERSRKSFSAPLSRVFIQVVCWNVESTRTTKKGKKPCDRK